MTRLTLTTLLGVARELAAHPWGEAEIDELVAPKLGIVTGFQDLLDDLETLRRRDLGSLPPAQGVRRRDAGT